MEVKKRKYCRAGLSALSCLFLLPGQATAETLTLSAAISLKESLATLKSAYEKESGDQVSINVGASGQLMDQVKNGAPVDLFLSAAPGQVDELEKAGLAAPNTKKVIARNSLVLIVPPQTEGLTTFADLAKDTVKRIAIGKPKAVPAGDYAVELFDHLKLTEAVKPKLVYGANVRQVLDYVRRGEVDAGLVYATDAKEAGDTVKVIATAPEDSHHPIEYVGVVIKNAKHADAATRFLDYLTHPAARAILAARGFVVDAPPK